MVRLAFHFAQSLFAAVPRRAPDVADTSGSDLDCSNDRDFGVGATRSHVDATLMVKNRRWIDACHLQLYDGGRRGAGRLSPRASRRVVGVRVRTRHL